MNKVKTIIFCLVIVGVLVLSCSPLGSRIIKPEFSVLPGVYEQDLEVELLCPTEGATIYYTLDGSAPDQSSARYVSPLKISASQPEILIQAVASQDEFSEVISGKFLVDPRSVSPVNSIPPSGTYKKGQIVTLSCLSVGAQVYYQIDDAQKGTEPLLYSGPFKLRAHDTVIRTWAEKDGLVDSKATTFTYHVPADNIFLSILSIIFTLATILGSLALFLYGMKTMSDGIQKVAGEKLHATVNLMTKNRVLGVLVGFFVTSIIQSSSATTVMVVSFANAGLLSLTQSIGVIMGANIGTTVTAWLVSFLGFKISISTFAIPCIGIGFPLIFSNNRRRRDFGQILVGFGLLFLGLHHLKNLVPEYDKSSPLPILSFVQNIENLPFYVSVITFILIGTLVTIVIQSSSAAMAITITLAAAGWITFPSAAALVLGENIGTTITAFLASLNANINAKRAARAHLLFNVFGVMWMLVVYAPFLKLIDFMWPGEISDKNIFFHLSLFHSMFNLINTLIFIWFVPQLASLVRFIIKEKPVLEKQKYNLPYISSGLQDTAEMNLLNAQKEVLKLAAITKEMFEIFVRVFDDPGKDLTTEVEQVKELEELTDDMQESISTYLAKCARENLNEQSSQNVTAMLRITHELESIADSCYNLMILIQRRYENRITFNAKAVEEIKLYSREVREFIDFYIEHLTEHLTSYDLDRAYKLEIAIDNSRNQLKANAQERLQNGSDVQTELLIIDIIRHFERIGDYALNVSQALRLVH